jgi:hypothetical protein
MSMGLLLEASNRHTRLIVVTTISVYRSCKEEVDDVVCLEGSCGGFDGFARKMLSSLQVREHILDGCHILTISTGRTQGTSGDVSVGCSHAEP